MKDTNIPMNTNDTNKLTNKEFLNSFVLFVSFVQFVD